MKTTERFDRAVTKLYNAFHAGTLNAMDCAHCAVGNMCDNNSRWNRFGIGQPILNRQGFINKTGYSGEELGNIEKFFIHGSIGGRKFTNTRTPNDVRNGYCSEIELRELQFKGLCAVVEYLCELDGIPNIMDYTKLFETENNQPKYELAL